MHNFALPAALRSLKIFFSHHPKKSNYDFSREPMKPLSKMQKKLNIRIKLKLTTNSLIQSVCNKSPLSKSIQGLRGPIPLRQSS